MSILTLVMGASLKEDRYSNRVIKVLRGFNYPVYAFGLRSGKVLDVQIDTQLKSYENIHTVTLYLNPKTQEPFYQYIINLKPERVIFNPGTENPEFYKLLEKENINVEVACSLVLLSTRQY